MNFQEFFVLNDPLRVMVNYLAGFFFAYFGILAIYYYQKLKRTLKTALTPELSMFLIGLHALFMSLSVNRMFWAVARHARYEGYFDYVVFNASSSLHIISMFVAVASVALILSPVKAIIEGGKVSWTDIYKTWALLFGVLWLGTVLIAH